MKYQISKIIKGYRSLAVEGKLLYLYKSGSIFSMDLESYSLSKISHLNFSKIYNILSASRLISRIFRLHPTTSIVFGNFLYIAFKSCIYKVCLASGSCQIHHIIPLNRRVLNFSIIKLSSIETLVFGEYFSNPNKDPVNIWKLDNEKNTWEVAYVFVPGVINHVHNIVELNNRIFVLTGDFGDASAIWLIDSEFVECKPLLMGSQQYRATWITQFENSFYYAMDSQLEQNYLICLEDLQFNKSNSLICDIPGSSIYNGNSLNLTKLIFSTSVECGEPSGVFLFDLFSNIRGPGIKSKYSHVFEYDLLNQRISEIFKASKDILPFRIFQFGSFLMPTGKMPIDTVILYGNALKKYDNQTLILKK